MTTNLGPKFDALLAECRAEEEAAEAPAPFRVDSAERAAWAVNKLLGFNEQEARLDAQYAAMKKAIADERASFEARFMLELEDWAKANPPAKGKTIKLLTGNLSFRTVNGGWHVTDKEALLGWAKENKPELVTVKTTTTESVSAEAVKALAAALAEESGEVLPGVEFFEDREAFDIKAPKTAKGED